MVFRISDEQREKEQIWIDPSIPLNSIAKLLEGPDFCSKRHTRNRDQTIPAPKGLQVQSRELKKLRATRTWIHGTRDEQVDQMNVWFPDISTSETTSPDRKKAKLQLATSRSVKGRSQKQSPTSPYQKTPCPDSDIGTLIKLPGEIRNRIYRMALLTPDPILVEKPYARCGLGRCVHAKLSDNAPGIAQTCKQLRWEALPIYLAENSAVQFDAGATHDSCSIQYLRTLGDYADLIPKYIFAMHRSIWKMDTFQEYAEYHFTITTPERDGSGEFSLEQWELAGRKVCQCHLEKLVVELNEKKKKGVPTGQAVIEMLKEDDESRNFADFAWRMKKTKQWPQHLAKCKECKEVTFNS